MRETLSLDKEGGGENVEQREMERKRRSWVTPF